MNNFHEEALEVIATVLGKAAGSLSDNDSPLSVGSWDSLKQMQLIVALEEKFNFRFSEDEPVFELLNVGKLIEAAQRVHSGASSTSPRL